jgi:hypothetical protein
VYKKIPENPGNLEKLNFTINATMWAIRYSPPAYVRRVRVVGKKRAQNRKIHYATPLSPQRKKLVRKVSIKPTYLRVKTPIETNPMSSSPTPTELLDNPMPDTATDEIRRVIPIMHIPCYAHAHGHTRPTHLRFAVGGSPCTARDRPVCDMQREVLFA